MKPLLALIGLMCAATISALGQIPGHPRLLFGPADIANITARIQVPGSAAQQLYQLVGNTATHYRTNYLFNGDNIPLPSEDPWYKSAQYHNVLALAFRYLVDPLPDTEDRDRAKFFAFNPTDYGILNLDERFQKQGIVYDDWITYRNQEGDLGRQLSQQVICLALLYDWLYSELDSTQRQLIRDRIIANINYQYDWFGFNAGIRGILVPPRPDRNRMRLEHPPLALMIGAMSIYGEAGSCYSTAQADADIAAAIQAEFTETESHINRYFSPYDGAEADGISYGMWMLHILVTELELWSRWTGQNHWNDQNVSDRFSRIGQWLAYELLPEPHASPCWFNTFSDAYSSMYSPLGLLLVLSKKYPSTAGINQWVFEHSVDSIRYVIHTSRAGHSPSNDQETQSNSMCYILPIIAGYQSVPAVEPTTVLPLSRHFTWNNLIYLRSSTTSWNGADDIQFGLAAGTDYHPLFQHHNWHHDQPDKGHFTLSAFNQLFIRSIGTDGRRSEYHNEVLIDGKGQVTTVLNTTHSKGWQGQNRGVITEFTSSPRFDFVDCDATDSYGALHWGIGLSNEVTYTRDDAGQNEVSEFNPVDHAHRYVSFSRASDGVPPYLVMADDIKKDPIHTITHGGSSRQRRSLRFPEMNSTSRIMPGPRSCSMCTMPVHLR